MDGRAHHVVCPAILSSKDYRSLAPPSLSSRLPGRPTMSHTKPCSRMLCPWLLQGQRWMLSEHKPGHEPVDSEVEESTSHVTKRVLALYGLQTMHRVISLQRPRMHRAPAALASREPRPRHCRRRPKRQTQRSQMASPDRTNRGGVRRRTNCSAGPVDELGTLLRRETPPIGSMLPLTTRRGPLGPARLAHEFGGLAPLRTGQREVSWDRPGCRRHRIYKADMMFG
jgi:hypothetical protein